MRYARCGPECFQQRVVDDNREQVSAVYSRVTAHGDMASEADNLVADGVLEAQYHANAHNHHGQSYRNSENGNKNSRTTHLVLVILVAVDSSGYEKREVHSVCPG